MFKGAADFNTITCNGNVSFDDSSFEGGDQTTGTLAADFGSASFGGQLICRGARFRRSVSFNSVKVERFANLQGARFDSGEQNFRYASFNRGLSLDEAVFRGRVSDFRYLHVDSSLSLKRAYFATDVNLGHAQISQKLRLGGSYFKKRVDLYDATIKILELLDVNYSPQAYPIEARIEEALRRVRATLYQ